MHPRMQQRAIPSPGISSPAASIAALAAAALFLSAIAAAASACEVLAVEGCVSPAISASVDRMISHRSRHSRQLRPIKCVETSGHALSFAWRLVLVEKSGTNQLRRASPPVRPSHGSGVRISELDSSSLPYDGSSKVGGGG